MIFIARVYFATWIKKEHLHILFFLQMMHIKEKIKKNAKCYVIWQQFYSRKRKERIWYRDNIFIFPCKIIRKKIFLNKKNAIIIFSHSLHMSLFMKLNATNSERYNNNFYLRIENAEEGISCVLLRQLNWKKSDRKKQKSRSTPIKFWQRE